MKIYKFYLNELINYYRTRGCEAMYKMNDNMDILIGFLHESNLANYTHKHRYLKELLLVKRYDDGKRVAFKVRVSENEKS